MTAIAPPRIARITHAQAKVLEELCRGAVGGPAVSIDLWLVAGILLGGAAAFAVAAWWERGW